jgi:hypothetical protein
VTSSWFFLSTLNHDARPTTHQIYKRIVVRISAEAMYLCFLQSAKAGCGAHQVSSVIGIRAKRPGRETDHSFLSSTKAINERSSASCSPYTFVTCEVASLPLSTCAYGQHCCSNFEVRHPRCVLNQKVQSECETV